jgi:predicted RNase H-like nuclease
LSTGGRAPVPVATGVGIDGCRGGWVVTVVTPGLPLRARVITRIEALDGLLGELGVAASCCLIDMPIGLPVSGPRPLDAAAKALLGAKASSLFTIPPRPVLDALDYAEAKQLSRASMGSALSIQAWNLLPRVRELDLHLRRRLPEPPRLRESHPELAFSLLAGAPLPSKQTAAGITARMAVLRSANLDPDPLFAEPPAHPQGRVAAHDLLDALVLALVASLAESAQTRLAPAPAIDPLGLPMEMILPAVTD